MKHIKLVLISDTHGLHRSVTVPDGDILIHAGDLTNRGELSSVADFDAFLAELPHPDKIVIAGNHDFCFERDPASSEALLAHCTYLFDREATIQGIRFYGSPWQPWFYDWAFNLARGSEIREKWDLIPEGIDALVTHGPPLGFGDRTAGGDRAGCADLLDAIGRVRPRLHVFGHIHEAYGRWSDGRTDFINASSCDLAYLPINEPVVYELEID